MESLDFVYFKYKPIEYFINSPYYDIKFSGPINWFNLEEFSISETGERHFDDYDYTDFHVEIKYDIITHNDEIHSAAYKENKIGQYIEEHNRETYFNEIPPDAIEKIYTREEYPEYYL